MQRDQRESTERSFKIWSRNIRKDGPRSTYHGKLAISIYALIDPRDGTVRYVGVTKDPERRLLEHRRSTRGTWEFSEWIAACRNNDTPIRMAILGRCAPHKWEEHERKWIAWFRRSHRLYNTHHGGLQVVGQERYGEPTNGWIPKPGTMRPGKIDEHGIYKTNAPVVHGTPAFHAHTQRPAAAPRPPASGRVKTPRPLTHFQEDLAEAREMQREQRLRVKGLQGGSR